jgi:hypothetical protein
MSGVDAAPQGKPFTGPKPRAVDEYEVDENQEQWQ